MLLIGQTPWMKNMEEKMTVKVEQKDCCSKKSAKGSCHKAKKNNEEKKDGCCQKTEARCACVCCYSIAPITENERLNSFNALISSVKILYSQAALAFQFYPVDSPPPDLVC